MHWGVSGVKGMAKGSVDGMVSELVVDEVELIRENKTTSHDDISTEENEFDSVVRNDIVL
jgi:hypothetical protein